MRRNFTAFPISYFLGASVESIVAEAVRDQTKRTSLIASHAVACPPGLWNFRQA